MRLHIVSGWRLALVAAGVLAAALGVAAVLALAVRFGHDMAGYLETSTGLVVDATVRGEAPAVPDAAPVGGDDVDTPPPVANEDAAELRPVDTVAVELQ